MAPKGQGPYSLVARETICTPTDWIPPPGLTHPCIWALLPGTGFLDLLLSKFPWVGAVEAKKNKAVPISSLAQTQVQPS